MNVIGFVVSIVLFVGGLVVMAYSFAAPGLEYLVFVLGLVATSLGFFIPVHILKRIDG